MRTQTLIGAAELATLAKTESVLIVDCRFDLADPQWGRRAYAAAHLPGAVYADLDADLSDRTKTGLGRHPLPDEDRFAAVLGRLGWTPQMPVVAYDAANGALAAARFWWMLRLVGAGAAVLDGGLAAWREAGLPLEAGEQIRPPTRPALRYAWQEIVSTETLQGLLRDPRVLLIDARGSPRFRGESETIDAVAGHVPGARNRSFTENLAADGRFKAPARLRAEFAALLAGRSPADVIHMCGSGVTACHNHLAMEHAGLVGSRIYAPSWSGWIADPTRPVARGAD
jgi:thiosulfate/3-mercaptopyruvate sulfurtransferase